MAIFNHILSIFKGIIVRDFVMNAIMSNALTGVITALLLDLHGNLLYANQQASGWLQIPEGEFYPAEILQLYILMMSSGGMRDVLANAMSPVQYGPASLCGNVLPYPSKGTMETKFGRGSFLLSGTDITGRRPAEPASVLHAMPFGLQHFFTEGVHCITKYNMRSGRHRSRSFYAGYDLLKNRSSGKRVS